MTAKHNGLSLLISGEIKTSIDYMLKEKGTTDQVVREKGKGEGLGVARAVAGLPRLRWNHGSRWTPNIFTVLFLFSGRCYWGLNPR